MDAAAASTFLLLVGLQHVNGISFINVSISGVGTVQGARQSKFNIDVFKGIPFAEPPVGKLRFKAPQPAKWSGFRNATEFGDICPQSGMLSQFTGNEDCLYLNIYRPINMVGRLPVMVWIHGGSFITGSGSFYDGGLIAGRKEVIVVTINYRLGILGFFSIPGTATRGNFGMFDQVLALRWVKQHIVDFGGDPKKVTIFGESAGAASVSLLTFSPMIKDEGLFIRAISQSGVAISFWAAYKVKENQKAVQLGKMLNCKDFKKQVECMRSKTAKEILLQQNKMLANADDTSTLMAPTLDGQFLKELPSQQMVANKLPKTSVEVIVGFNDNEGTMFAGDHLGANRTSFKGTVKKYLPERTGKSNAILEQAAIHEYTKYQSKESALNWYESSANFIGDVLFVIDAINFARSWANQGNSVYMYRFSHLPEPETLIRPFWKVHHALEIQYIFGAPIIGVATAFQKNYTEIDRNISRHMMEMWASFAKSGKPSKNWPKFSAGKQEHLNIGRNLVVEQKPWPRAMAFWDELVPKIKNGTEVKGCDMDKVKSSSVKLNVNVLYLVVVMFIIKCLI